MNILGIIPARAGSKGIASKNMYPLCGRPLIDWTIVSTSLSCLGDNFVIATDIVDINHEFALFLPSSLCKDDSKIIDVLQHLLNIFSSKYDAFCLLQPTSPLRTRKYIDDAIKLFKSSNATSLYSGYYMGIKTKDKTYSKYTSPKHFQRNGAIFIAKRELIEQGKLWDDDVIEFEMPFSRSIDIDTMDDMRIAEALLEYRVQGGQI